MLITTRAVVFGSIKYGEADLIVSCFTEQKGLRSYLLRGIRKSKKGRLKTSLFQPLTQLELVASHKERGTLETMKEAKLLSVYQSLHSNVIKSSVVFFLSEVLRNSIREEEANPALFEYLETSLHWFDEQENFASFHLLFLLKLTRYLGFYPDDTERDKDFFNLLDGTFQEVKTNEYCISGENLELLKLLLGINFDALPAVKLNQASRSSFLSMMLVYYELHLQGFRKPKSLVVLNEIFN